MSLGERTYSPGGLPNPKKPSMPDGGHDCTDPLRPTQLPRHPDPLPRRQPPPPRFGPPPHSPAWEREINKMIGRQVTVTQYVGIGSTGAPLFIDHVGVCVALQSTHLSVILMTDEDKLIIKNVAAIRRTRSRNNPPAKTDAQTLGEVLGEALKGAPE